MSPAKEGHDIATKLVHAGERLPPPRGLPVSTPVYATATFTYETGMAALHAALFACELGPGSTVLASQDLYGASTDLLYTVFGSFGVKTVTADFSRPAELREKARAVAPRVLVAETISNPLL